MFSKNVIWRQNYAEERLRNMSNTNICWECRHSILKLKILVPLKSPVKEYANKTGDFQSDIVAISKDKPGTYNVWYRSNGALRLLSFKMFHVCRLKQGQEKNGLEGACVDFDKNGQSPIDSIVYSEDLDVQSKEE
jgi:hypothetical protein